MSTSPEEIIRLRLELKIMLLPPTSLVEWCSTCTSTRLVSLVLPEEEHEVKEAVKEETKNVEVEKANSRHSNSKREEQMRLQEESASPLLKRRSAKVGKEEEEVKVLGKESVKEVKEEGCGLGKEVSSSGSTYFTLRSFPTVAGPQSTQPHPFGPCLPSSPPVAPPLFTPPWIPLHLTQQFGQMPAANWGLPDVGNCGSFLGCPQSPVAERRELHHA